jgi:integrase/recombinase XerD
MKCIINNQVVLSRAPEGPLAAQIGSFAETVSKQGYSLASIHRQVLLAACFSRWLQQNGIGLRSLCSDHPARYLRYRARHVRLGRGDAAALKHLIGFLRGEGVIPREKKLACQPTPVELVPKHSGNIYWKYAHWPARQSSTTFRSFAVFSKTVSVPHESRSRVCVQAML